MRRAQSFPMSAEPVEPCGNVEDCSPPPPYSAPAVQNFIPGNDNGRFNYCSPVEESRNISKLPSIPETSKQDNQESVLTEGKSKLNSYKP